ncbi:MAG: zinc ABC transporter substrate-binding protein [Acholeplasmatales bacterium]|nr:zinc ABC transporter substrate-binding protein [Acholeplasmatales bacterium]
MRKRLLGIILLLFGTLFTLSSCGNNKTDIVSTCFAGYDLARAVAKDKKTTSMLLKPGLELHDYSPSPADIERVISSEIFIYIGGESDETWVEQQILPSVDKNKTKIINMMELVKNSGKTYNEEDPESAEIKEDGESEEELELDEHIWNSFTNQEIILSAICKALCEIDNENESYYLKNRDSYYEKLHEVDIVYKDTIAAASKNLIVFADRFPLLYFVKEYGLQYDAAFKGCDTDTNSNPLVTERLTKKIEDNNLRVVFVIELSELTIADTIISNCKNDGFVVEKMVFYTMHNVSTDDYNNGVTMVDLMKKNILSLKEALN